MISAVTDSCTVRLDKVNRRVYKFRALVFNEDSEGNTREEYLHHKTVKQESDVSPRGILSQQPKTEWKCAYNKLLHGTNELPKLLSRSSPSGPRKKKSKTSQELSNISEIIQTEKPKVHFEDEGEESSKEETRPFGSCLDLTRGKEEYSRLMEKPKEELVSMIMELKLTLQDSRRRKKGYIPSDKDVAALKNLDCSSSETKTKKKQPRTRRRSARNKRLISI